MVRVTVGGQAEMRDLAADLRREARALQRRVVLGAQKAVRPLESLIKIGTSAFLPSGYAPIMAGALSVKTTTRLARGSPGVTITVSAKGLEEERDVSRIDEGVLRHPVFGRYKKLRDGTIRVNPWDGQKVTPEFVMRPYKAMRPHIIRTLDEVLDDVRVRIEKG